jgi:hypothetical protein
MNAKKLVAGAVGLGLVGLVAYGGIKAHQDNELLEEAVKNERVWQHYSQNSDPTKWEWDKGRNGYWVTIYEDGKRIVPPMK